MKRLASMFLVLLAVAAPAAEAAQSRHHHKSKGGYHPLHGTIYMTRQPGGYSYHYTDTINSNRLDPSINGSWIGAGPLDGDFFFASPRPPHGGNTPYMH
jgi:hypothetical protein